MWKKNFTKKMIHNDCGVRKKERKERAMETEKSNTLSAITQSRRSEENVTAVSEIM